MIAFDSATFNIAYHNSSCMHANPNGLGAPMPALQMNMGGRSAGGPCSGVG